MIYIVFPSEHPEDCHVEAVFTKLELAYDYIEDFGGEIEKFEVDVPIEERGTYLVIYHGVNGNTVAYFYDREPFKDKKVHSVHAKCGEKTYINLTTYVNTKDMAEALKVAQDRFFRYQSELQGL